MKLKNYYIGLKMTLNLEVKISVLANFVTFLGNRGHVGKNVRWAVRRRKRETCGDELEG